MSDYLNEISKYAFKHFVPCHYAVFFTIKVIHDSVMNIKLSMSFYLFIYLFVYWVVLFKQEAVAATATSTFIPCHISLAYLHYRNTCTVQLSDCALITQNNYNKH